MAYAKAVVDFSKYQDGDLAGPANTIHGQMLVTNAATFPSPPLTAPQFLAVITAWITALGESLKGGKDRTTTKTNARAALEDALSKLGTYVNLVANGDQATIDLSGFPSYTTAHAPSNSGITFIPQDVRWENGVGAGAETLRWKGDGTHATYEVQTCMGDPNTAANWTYKGSFSGGRAELSGLAVASTVWGRVRKIGTGGATGDWSDPAQVMVT